jgi:hypothetical protein
MKLYTGKPANPGILRFRTNSVTYGKTEKVRQDHYLSHSISKLCGVSFSARWFIGLIVFSERTAEYVDTPISETPDEPR